MDIFIELNLGIFEKLQAIMLYFFVDYKGMAFKSVPLELLDSFGGSLSSQTKAARKYGKYPLSLNL